MTCQKQFEIKKTKKKGLLRLVVVLKVYRVRDEWIYASLLLLLLNEISFFCLYFFYFLCCFYFSWKKWLDYFFLTTIFQKPFQDVCCRDASFLLLLQQQYVCKKEKKYVYSRHDSCYLAFKKWERNMDNLSNALFLLEASDSFISFANFFLRKSYSVSKSMFVWRLN